MAAAFPDRTDGVDDMAHRRVETKRRCCHRIPGRTRRQRSTRLRQPWPRCPVNGTIHATAAPSDSFAAVTTASTSCWVISPKTTSILTTTGYCHHRTRSSQGRRRVFRSSKWGHAAARWPTSAGTVTGREPVSASTWAAGLIAARAVIAYGKYVVDLTRAMQSAAEPADAQPMAELSDAERAAAAAAESAAAYQKYVATPAAAVGPSDADRTAETTVTDKESGPPAGWSPAV